MARTSSAVPFLLLVIALNGATAQCENGDHECAARVEAEAAARAISDRIAIEQSEERDLRARRDDLVDFFEGDPTRVPVRVPLFIKEERIRYDCPECPLSLVTYLDEATAVTASAACASLPDSVHAALGGRCTAVLENLIAERQLVRFFDLGTELDDHMRGEGVNMRSVEGKSFNYLEKLRLMRRLALHPSVETVCEVGFNAGHSALLWLSSGVRRVLSFELGQYGYSSHAVGWLSERYPGRLQVVMGDSLRTVPNFSAMWPDERCNLLFVDGGHLYRHAMGDLVNLRPLRNESFHYLLVDDTDQGEVAAAWRDYQAEGHAVESETVWSDYSEVFIWDDRAQRVVIDEDWDDGAQRVVIDEDRAPPKDIWRSSISVGTYNA